MSFYVSVVRSYYHVAVHCVTIAQMFLELFPVLVLGFFKFVGFLVCVFVFLLLLVFVFYTIMNKATNIPMYVLLDICTQFSLPPSL